MGKVFCNLFLGLLNLKNAQLLTPLILFSPSAPCHFDISAEEYIKVLYFLMGQPCLTSADVRREINEIALAKLETIPSTLIKPPRIKNSPIHLECIHFQSVQLPTINDNYSNRLIIGKVIGIHIDDSVIENGKIDIRKIKPIARLGYSETQPLKVAL